ncbi:hypothetical protein BDF21DRAFT_407207 [Thamnidium elegans]|nr:hypothetical protein BDF21DRAFT_407207 [Thamnidium elegans]
MMVELSFRSIVIPIDPICVMIYISITTPWGLKRLSRSYKRFFFRSIDLTVFLLYYNVAGVHLLQLTIKILPKQCYLMIP